MYITKTYRFEASHILPRHPGKCANLHGHSWKLAVTVFGMVNSDTGFVMDYHDLDKIVEPIVDRFDHKHLNGYVRYPSSENIAIHIAHLLEVSLRGNHYRVAVSETAKSWSVWDSRNHYCQEIFSQELLDSAAKAMDAGWRSPEISPVASAESADEALSVARIDYVTALEELNKYAAEVHQIELYMESLGKPGAIMDELAPYLSPESDNVFEKLAPESNEKAE